ncbi:MAG: thioesterase family protein [Bacteroidales bacterium]|nr:thioesterase family protein [Bacteroidales bacterium]
MEIGLTKTSQLTVSKEHLAESLGSGNLAVLATPAMVALMENAAMNAVADELPAGSTTVGSSITTSHVRPTILGGIVKATATLTAVEGRKLEFVVKAEDELGIIGEGEHIRFIVDVERFMSKAKEGR